VLLNDTHTAQEVGDEPLQYFKKFKKISVAVDVNRVAGISRLMTAVSPEVFLLDDAYQHRKVRGSLSLLLTKYDDLFTDDYLLPTGNLRESSRGVKRADLIIVTKCPSNITASSKNTIREKLKRFDKTIFFTTISYHQQTSGSHRISMEDLKKYQVLLITGIANPSSLLSFMDENKVNFSHCKFPDHHHFTDKDIQVINEQFAQLKSNKKLILTTEKDYVRLENRIEELSFLGIETTFLSEQEKFNSIIRKQLR